jgi:hypothetical protein
MLVAASLLVAAPAGSSAGSHVSGAKASQKNKVYGVEDCGEPAVEPNRIVFACADFGLYANHFDWDHWGHRKATANGVLHAKVCKPDCASGHYKDYPVELTLHKIKKWSCNGFRARFYRKIKMSFPGARPPNIESYVHSEFFCV